MKQKLWLTLVTCLAYCIDKELYEAIDYLREQVRVLVEHQEKQDKRIRLNNSQRMRVAAKAMRDRWSRCVEKVPEWCIFSRLACLGTFGAGLLAVSMARSVEMAVPIGVSLTMWRAGAPIMKSNGKSRMRHTAYGSTIYEAIWGIPV